MSEQSGILRTGRLTDGGRLIQGHFKKKKKFYKGSTVCSLVVQRNLLILVMWP